VRTGKCLAEVAHVECREELPKLPEAYDAGAFMKYATGHQSRAVNVEAGPSGTYCCRCALACSDG
jgi:hypothetical protein